MKLINKIEMESKYPIKIINRMFLTFNFPLRWKIKFFKYYGQFMYLKFLKYLDKAHEYIKKHPYYKHISHKNSGIIWTFWWQGVHDMPLIIKRCIQSIEKHSNNHPVVLITKYNIHKYTTIPKFIFKKLNNNEMTLTHFSDILRFNLLYNYGGLWIDSTVFCSSNLGKNYFGNIYTSGGYDFVQSRKLYFAKWTEFLIGGKSHNELFQFMNTFFRVYWRQNKYLIDYLLVDYGLAYAYKHNMSNFKYYVNNIACNNNHHLYDLVDCLNKKFNQKEYNHIISNTNLFKLSRHQNFDYEHDTFYKRLIDRHL